MYIISTILLPRAFPVGLLRQNASIFGSSLGYFDEDAADEINAFYLRNSTTKAQEKSRPHQPRPL
jgi:hypothetical protein